jgi:glyoxylase-like metal-dependent hydrolase (beta-lactamase superfamily II)
MDITPFHDQNTGTMTYIVSCSERRECAIIDPVLDYNPHDGVISFYSAEKVIQHIKDYDLTVRVILETHVHADHLSASRYLKNKLGGKIGISQRITEVQHTFSTMFNLSDCRSDGAEFDLLLKDQQSLQVGQLSILVVATPGHTPACVCYKIGEHIFVGDTIFSPNLGTARCDFPGGSAETLFASIEKLLAYPDSCKLYVGHDYPGVDEQPSFVHTIGEQKDKNPYLQDFNETSFVKMRSERDKTLGAPKLLFPSLQVNIRGGQLPTPETNGQRYLKIPLTGNF